MTDHYNLTTMGSKVQGIDIAEDTTAICERTATVALDRLEKEIAANAETLSHIYEILDLSIPGSPAVQGAGHPQVPPNVVERLLDRIDGARHRLTEQRLLLSHLQELAQKLR
jgi:hypothetical protein